MVQVLSSPEVVAGAARLGLDVLSMLVLVGWLYRRRIAAPEMLLVFTALNIGLFAALTGITAGHFPAGVGFGLFGLLSLVRLRSAAFTLKDVAYTFTALVLALVNGLPARGLALPAALDVVLVLAIWAVDDSRRGHPSRVMRLTLDHVHGDLESVATEVRRLVSVEPLSVVIEEVDVVRETTRVSVRYAFDDAWWQSADAQAAVEPSDEGPGGPAGAARS